MDNNLYLTQELNKKRLRADLGAKLAHLEHLRPITLKIIHEARMITTEFLVKVGCNYKLTEPVDLDYIPQGDDLIFVALNMTTLALMEGVNLYQKKELVTEEFTFWEFTEGTIRKDNKTNAIVFVPAIIYKHIDMSQLLKPE